MQSDGRLNASLYQFGSSQHERLPQLQTNASSNTFNITLPLIHMNFIAHFRSRTNPANVRPWTENHCCSANTLHVEQMEGLHALLYAGWRHSGRHFDHYRESSNWTGHIGTNSRRLSSKPLGVSQSNYHSIFVVVVVVSSKMSFRLILFGSSITQQI